MGECWYKISVSYYFCKNQREIYVEGEVYLEVAPDKNRPFIVRTDNMQVRVLGTKFNVTAYNDDALKRVVLVSGKVEVRTNEKERVLLKPNQLFAYENNRIQVKMWMQADIYCGKMVFINIIMNASIIFSKIYPDIMVKKLYVEKGYPLLPAQAS